MINLVPYQAYVLLGALALGAGAYGVYKYQERVIGELRKDIATQNTEILHLKANLVGVNTAVDRFRENQAEMGKIKEDLRKNISRAEEILLAKPTLMSKKIESSYKNFHLEKSCFSGNVGSCDEIKKDK